MSAPISRAIYALLCNTDSETRLLPEEFSSDDVGVALTAAGVKHSHGSITGFLTKAQRGGLISQVDKRGRMYIYRVLNRAADIRVGTHATAGGAVDRRILRSAAHPTQRSLADRLLQLAADVENMKIDLSVVPEDVLLAELARRARSRARANGNGTA